MSKQTLLLILALLAITAMLFYVALKQQAPAPVTQVAIPTPTPIAQTQLNFGTLLSTPSALGKITYSLPVTISTGTNKVTAVQLELQYDPSVINTVAVAPGPFLANPVILLNKIDQKNGRVSYALGISPQDSGKLGSGNVAILTFETLVQTPTQTTIQFLPKSLVTAEGIIQSVLAGTNSAQITLMK